MCHTYYIMYHIFCLLINKELEIRIVMANQKNYYEMAYRLYNVMCELVNTDKQDFTELYEKSRAIIFDYNILKEKYLKKVRSICKYTQDKKFIDLCKKNYNLIKENINKRADDRGLH